MYKVRALFHIPACCRIGSNEKKVELSIYDQTFYLSGYNNDSAISDNNILTIESEGYQKEDVAGDFAVLLNHALMLTALDLRIGISYDDHCMVNFFNEPLKEFFNENFSSAGICAKRDFGLSVLKTTLNLSRWGLIIKKNAPLQK